MRLRSKAFTQPKQQENRGSMSHSSCMFLSTRDIKAPERNLYWMESVRQHVIQVDCPSPSVQGIRAELEQTDCGDITINRIKADTHSVQRSRTDIAGDGRQSIFLCAILEGHGYSWQGTQCTNHSPGDIVLYDTTRPYGQGFPGDMEVLVVDIPRQVINQYMGQWNHPDLIKIDRNARLGDVSCQDLHKLLGSHSNCQTENRLLPEQLMQLLNVMLGHRVLPATSRSRQQLLHRALRCIEQNLGNEALNTEYLCAALSTSPRQLSRAFELEGVPPNHYIWALRLKRCRQELIANPGSSISDIAFRSGFNHSAHFSRSYKKCFGETPTETRQRALAR